MADSTSEPLTIRLRENGPLVIHGPFRLVNHRGEEIPLPGDKPLVALCRCGQSANKPFCDGTHKQIGFVGESPVWEPSPRPGTGTNTSAIADDF